MRSQEGGAMKMNYFRVVGRTDMDDFDHFCNV